MPRASSTTGAEAGGGDLGGYSSATSWPIIAVTRVFGVSSLAGLVFTIRPSRITVIASHTDRSSSR